MRNFLIFFSLLLLSSLSHAGSFTNTLTCGLTATYGGCDGYLAHLESQNFPYPVQCFNDCGYTTDDLAEPSDGEDCGFGDGSKGSTSSQSCEQPPPPEPEPDSYICQDGRRVATLAECDVDWPAPPDEQDWYFCYDGSMVRDRSLCPEFTPDPEVPDSTDHEPNCICESGNYGYASADPDCSAPPPNPCLGECGPDDITPDFDHDGDGIPNQYDPDADNDGDGIPNGVDPDFEGSPQADDDGDGIPNEQDNESGCPEGQVCETDDTTSGGESCETPPQCKGDPIGCAILRDTWKDRCESDQQLKGAGTCKGEQGFTPFSCKGDPIACAMIGQMTQERCDAINFANSLEQAIDDDMNSLGLSAGPNLGENGELADVRTEEDLSNDFASVINTSKPYSASCPANRDVSFSFATMAASYEPMCDMAYELSFFVRLLTSLIVGFMFVRSLLSFNAMF